jgi:hypothetical protein
MFLFIHFVCPALSSDALSMRGNWSDSLAYDETILFFESLDLRAVPPIRRLLSGHIHSDYHSILKVLQSELPKPVHGLLRLCLIFRIFHPSAAIVNPVQNATPVLRGWAAAYADPLPDCAATDFQWKFLSAIYAEDHGLTRIRTLRKFLHRPRLYFWNISEQIPDPKIRVEFESQKFLPHMHQSSINGRIVSDDAHDIARTI